jgi:hypothetical protein
VPSATDQHLAVLKSVARLSRATGLVFRVMGPVLVPLAIVFSGMGPVLVRLAIVFSTMGLVVVTLG